MGRERAEVNRRQRQRASRAGTAGRGGQSTRGGVRRRTGCLGEETLPRRLEFAPALCNIWHIA